MGCGIYSIKNIINDKRYIGSSIEVPVRLMKHKYSLRGNYHDNQYLQNSFNKHGEDKFIFKLLENCEEEDLIDRENHYIKVYESNNLSKG
jgi:group I intron endonuclease